MKSLKKLIVFGLTAFVAIFGIQGITYAVPSTVYSEYAGLWLSDGTNSVLVLDNDGTDTNAQLGVVGFNGSLGDWTVNVTTLISYPSLGSVASPQIDLNSVNVFTNTSGTLDIWGSVSGFNPATGSAFFEVGGTTQGSVQFVAYSDWYDGWLFFDSYPITTTPVFSPGAFSGSFSGPVHELYGGTVDYTIWAHITQEGAGATSFDASLRKVPEPLTMLLLGCGLVGVWGFRRRIKK